MRRPFRLLTVLGLCLPVAAPACRREPAPDPAQPVAEAPENRWGPAPPESLYGATAAENLRVLEVVIEARGIPRGWDGMRVAVLSDLLVGGWRDNVRVAQAAIQAAVRAEPDLIVLAGNVLGDGGDPALLREAMRPLQGRPAMAVLGVRDVRTDSLAAIVASQLRGSGVTVIRNEALGFARGGDTAYVVGVEPVPGTSSPRSVADILAQLPEETTTPLLISNLAEVLGTVPEQRFPVIISGNAFCGSAEVPNTPRFADLVDGPLAVARIPRVNRLFQARGSTLFVSCGTGYTFVPVRWGAPPEVAVVTLHRIPEPQPAATPDPGG